MSEKLNQMKAQKEKAEQKLRYYQHQEKMLERRILEQPHKISTITGTSKPVTTVRRSNGSKRLV